jgi:hypothetical protein
MATPARLNRQKISTTVSAETLAFLERLVKAREAGTLAEAIDLVVERLRAAETRERLERDTAAYFDQMTQEELAEENQLAGALSRGARGVDFDHEP